MVLRSILYAMFVVHDIVGRCSIGKLNKGATNGGGCSGSCGLTGFGSTCSRIGRVVVVETSWLDELVWNAWQGRKEAACDDWTNDQDDEKDEQGEEHDGVANNATSSELRLLEGVDWRANLATGKFVSYNSMTFEKLETYLGRSQKSMTEWNLSTYGTRSAGIMKNNRRCPKQKSAAK